MTHSQPNELTKRLLIRTIPGYAERQIDEMTDQLFEDVTDNLSRYAEAIQAQIPPLWGWFSARHTASPEERKAIDVVYETALKDEFDLSDLLADLIELYLADYPQEAALYDLALHQIFTGVPDSEIERIIKGERTL